MTEEPQSPALLCKTKRLRLEIQNLWLWLQQLFYLKNFSVSAHSPVLQVTLGLLGTETRRCLSTCQKTAPRCPVRAGLLENCKRCCGGAACYLEGRLQAADVAALTQGCLHGVDDHVAHAHPGALGEPSCLRVSDQRVADGFREQLGISKDENPAWGRRTSKEVGEMR